jgi:uncharacterized protein (TIGR03067 family)
LLTRVASSGRAALRAGLAVPLPNAADYAAGVPYDTAGRAPQGRPRIVPRLVLAQEEPPMRMIAPFGLVGLALLLGSAVAQEKDKLDPAKLVGTWTYVSGEKDGKKIPAANLEKGTVKITKENITLESPEGNFVIKYKLEAAKTPADISMEITEGPQGVGAKSQGIVALNKGELKICYAAMDGGAPKEFATKEGSGLHLFVLKKKK